MLMVMIVAGSDVAISVQNEAEEYLRRGDNAFNQRYSLPDTGDYKAELELYRPFLEEAIYWYEKAWQVREQLPLPSQAHVANRLAQLKYELTTYYHPEKPEDQPIRERLFWEGKEWGFRSLRLTPNFNENKFIDSLQLVKDPAALLWTAHNWGSWLGYKPLEGLINIGKIKAMYERVLEVEPTYYGASAHNALGALLMTTPELLGGNPHQGKKHLETAIALAPDYLTNHAVYAEFYGFIYDIFGKRVGIRTRDLEGKSFDGEKFIQEKCEFVLKAPVGNKWPFWNRVAKKSAAFLLEELKRLRR